MRSSAILCLIVAIAVITVAGTLAEPEKCSPRFGYCQVTEQCCKNLVCSFYTAKCVDAPGLHPADTVPSVAVARAAPKTCSPKFDYCQVTEQCCENLICSFYTAKCVDAPGLHPVDTVPSVAVARAEPKKCSPKFGYCQVSDQCCKNLICLPYLAKCIDAPGVHPVDSLRDDVSTFDRIPEVIQMNP